ncbi:P-loop containing nucleoside triphosphate hydrolase [Pseudocohnilembus persalinus]|uniref:Kinesin-like protein n=1 Tax=Pseudocohnilembus persalinus TaxID=266149 RepID=A0A0V0QJ43_PSEPJ|nr:P-loop containing nucleoside triphosphate hydrolase [Pseudocohnilembus persalinus]|eukprot:KRX02258.1 P-loop containing nucleoside triphosphate hydrolase [Pseudocohnilembus persalinus]
MKKSQNSGKPGIPINHNNIAPSIKGFTQEKLSQPKIYTQNSTQDNNQKQVYQQQIQNLTQVKPDLQSLQANESDIQSLQQSQGSQLIYNQNQEYNYQNYSQQNQSLSTKPDETPRNGEQEEKNQKILPKSKVVKNIESMKQKREERRQLMNNLKSDKAKKCAVNQAQGKNGDIDFLQMIQQQRFPSEQITPHVPSSSYKLCVLVRKRPIFEKEEEKGEIDAISCSNPMIRVHAPKFKVDGITKYVENFDFTFDNTFGEKQDTESVYQYSLKPILNMLQNQGIVTCFAYGQTGSGKTFTMKGLQERCVNDLYYLAQQTNPNVEFYLSFFEIYGQQCCDLLNDRNKIAIQEDQNNNIQLRGLVEQKAVSPEEMFTIIEFGNNIRTTHSTTSNDESSRSHAVCQIILKEQGNVMGKLILVDLAGSERAQDCQNNEKQRRQEGAFINSSLLALKECIRALDKGAQHVPFRGSKLTLILRDSFQSKQYNSKVIMIACVSPGSSSSEHSINTLRYADRLKDNRTPIQKQSHVINQEQLYTKKSQQKTLDQLSHKFQPEQFGKNKENQIVNTGQKKNVFPIEADLQQENEYINPENNKFEVDFTQFGSFLNLFVQIEAYLDPKNIEFQQECAPNQEIAGVFFQNKKLFYENAKKKALNLAFNDQNIEIISQLQTLVMMQKHKLGKYLKRADYIQDLI